GRVGSHLSSSGKLGPALFPGCTHNALICHCEWLYRLYGITSCSTVGKCHLYFSLVDWIVITLLAGQKRTSLMPTPPLISIIIVSWNSAKHLPRSLDCLSRQTFQDFEIILVDNGSLDGGTNDLEQQYPQLALRIERLSSNEGFALANNRGARMARGKWLSLLNADAFPEPNWLESLL